MPVLPALLTMAVAQFFDLGTFIAMLERIGPHAEANPIVLSVLDSLGMPGILLAKVALTVLVAAVSVVLLSRPEHRDRFLGALVLGWAILAGVIGGGSNALTMAAA